MWSRLACVGKIAIMNEVLLRYRIHNSQISSSKADMQKEYGYKIYTNIYKRLNINLCRDDYEAHYALVNDKKAPSYSNLVTWCNKIRILKNQNSIIDRKFYERQINYYLYRNTLGHLVFRNYSLNLETMTILINPKLASCFLDETIRRFFNKISVKKN